MTWVVVNMEPASFYQGQTDTYLASFNTRISGNDYLSPGVQVQLVRNLFASPTGSNPDPRPVFAAINCISNSPNRRYREVLLNEFYNGGAQQDFGSNVTNTWRVVLDAVQAPPPELTDVRSTTGGVFRFTVPAQRGRTNRVESTTNFANWITVMNISGTNASVVIRETNIFPNPRRFYRLLRF